MSDHGQNTPSSRPAARHVRERAALVAALREASPTDPTLCEGWEARHLAAHIWVRQQHPLHREGPRFARLVDDGIDPVTYAAIVDRVAAPPSAWSPHAWAGDLMNVAEFFVHTEDVRRGPAARAAGDLPPARALDADVERSLWRDLGLLARAAYRRAAPGVVLVAPGTGRRVVSREREGAGVVTLTGPVGELVLHAFGRGWAAHLEVDGPPDAVRALDAVRPLPAHT